MTYLKNNLECQERNIFFEITNICNHRCIHCCKYWENNTCARTATKETLDKILAMPKRHLTISGGEPSLVKDKVRYLVENEKTGITINTNLSNWTIDDISYLVSHGVDFNVSIVSLDKKIYKSITNADTYSQTFKNLEALPKKNTFITMVINRLNEQNIDYTVAILILMGFRNIMVTPQKPSPGEAVDVASISSYIQSIHQKYYPLANIMTQGYCDIIYCDHKCNAGIGRFVIDTQCNVYPCAPIHKDCCLGTIDTPIDELKKRGAAFYLSYPKEQRALCKGFM